MRSRLTPVKASRKDWLFHFFVVPVFLAFLFFLGKHFPRLADFLVLSRESSTLASLYLSNFFHESFAGHLLANLIFYATFAFLILVLESEDVRAFRSFSVLAFTIIPVFMSSLVLKDLVFGRFLGFSGITSLFGGYFVFSFSKYLSRRKKPTLVNFAILLLTLNLILSGWLDGIFFVAASLVSLVCFFSLFSEMVFNAKSLLLLWFGKKKNLFQATTVTISCFAVFYLPIILPKDFILPGGAINIYEHYLGWVLGIALGFACSSLVVFFTGKRQ